MKADKINAKYLALHNALGTKKDAVDKDLFDQQHRQIWNDWETELKAKLSKSELVVLGY